MLCYFQKGNGLHWKVKRAFKTLSSSFHLLFLFLSFFLSSLHFFFSAIVPFLSHYPLIRRGRRRHHQVFFTTDCVLLWQIRESGFVGVDEVSDDFTNFSARKHTVRPLLDRLSKLGFQEPSCAQDSGAFLFTP
ncbi:hypothetical protein QL285_082562 [Trifolium repens]|nr:hypothetical protein QL285_082562 [Trifolium repens]